MCPAAAPDSIHEGSGAGGEHPQDYAENNKGRHFSEVVTPKVLAIEPG